MSDSPVIVDPKGDPIGRKVLQEASPNAPVMPAQPPPVPAHVQHFEQASELLKKADALNRLGALGQAKGRLFEARKLYRQSADEAPDVVTRATILTHVVTTHERLQEYEDCLAVIQEAIAALWSDGAVNANGELTQQLRQSKQRFEVALQRRNDRHAKRMGRPVSSSGAVTRNTSQVEARRRRQKERDERKAAKRLARQKEKETP